MEMIWEYKVQTPTVETIDGFIAACNEAGKEGWQLIESWETVFRDHDGPGQHKFVRLMILGRPAP